MAAHGNHRRRSLQLDAYERPSLDKQSLTLYTPYSQTRRRRTSLDNPCRDGLDPGASSVIAHSPVANIDPFSRISDGSGDEASSGSVAIISSMKQDAVMADVDAAHGIEATGGVQDACRQAAFEVRGINRAPAISMEERRQRQLASSPWTANSHAHTSEDPWGRPGGLQDYVNGGDINFALQPAGLMQARAAIIADRQNLPDGGKSVFNAMRE